MKPHPFDAAVALSPGADGVWLGHTSDAYANMVGPFGGITAAQILNAVMLDGRRLGEPLSLTVNFAAGVAEGPFELRARAARTNRSTQHWIVEMVQDQQTVTTATVVTAVRRDTWALDDEPMPECPPPAEVAVVRPALRSRWFDQYEMRLVAGGVPEVWDGGGDSSLSMLWVRDSAPRALDALSLAAMSDVFFPRVYRRRAVLVPAGTVSMTVYFHASARQLQSAGSGYVLARARAHAFRQGFHDQVAQLWSETGDILTTTHQVVYYKS